jgi:hypothetical protein
MAVSIGRFGRRLVVGFLTIQGFDLRFGVEWRSGSCGPGRRLVQLLLFLVFLLRRKLLLVLFLVFLAALVAHVFPFVS